MYDVKYFVNEKKGVVVCKIGDIRCALHEEMAKKDLGFPPAFMCDLLMTIPDGMVGKARCSQGDTFDEEKGRKIAYKRAVHKVNRSKKKFMRRFMQIYTTDYNTTIKLMHELEVRYESAEANAKEDLAKIMQSL